MLKRLHLLFSLILGLILSLAAPVANGQSIGVWQFHGAYSNTKTLAEANGTVYVAGDYSAYRYEAETGELHDFTRLDGLSDNAYSKLAYNAAERTLIVAYSTGNIDLVKDGIVQNEPALLNANILGSRRINHIAFRGSLAYLSCDFGIVVLDLARREIKASNTNLDATSANTPVPVLAADAQGDRLFLATATKGILSIGLNQNLMDSRLYTIHGTAEGLPFDNSKLKSVFRYNGRTYAGYDSPYGYYAQYGDGSWHDVLDSLLPKGGIRSIVVKDGQLLACIDNTVYLRKNPAEAPLALNDTVLVDPQEAVFGENGVIYAADKGTGMVKINTAATPIGYNAFRPNGPFFELPFKLYAKGSRLYALSGGYNGIFQTDNIQGYSVYENGFWSNYNQYNNSLSTNTYDLVSAYETNEGLYLSSFANGVIFKGNNTDRYRYYSDTAGRPNSLVNAGGAAGRFVRVTDLKTDFRGDRWILNYTSDASLHRWTTDNEWTAFTLAPQNRAVPAELLIDESSIKWLRMHPVQAAQSSVIAFREGNPNTEGFITNQTGQGGLPSNAVYDMAMDRDGILWLGTGAGLAALYSPSVVLSGEAFDVTLPIFDGRPVLENDIVTAIALDGGDRKWIGTRNSGIWLFDKEVTRVLAHYTFDNSPLPSNAITDLAIAGQSGKLFIATDRGLLSLRIDATDVMEGETPKDNCVRIFPNPVRPDFQGTIGIECLPENAIVKITDQANRLVYETRANGGTATWNGKNYNGRKAAPGVYYVYAVTQGQRSGVVGKIAIVH